MKNNWYDCNHEHVKPTVCDQTLGVECVDCELLLAYCWRENHIAEVLWNRACTYDEHAKPCLNTRDNVCAICEQPSRFKLIL